jgi:hypothetical protein
MPRKLRVEYPGAMYHVMSRGNRREDIFLNDVDLQDHSGALHRESAEAKARGIITEELKRLGWGKNELSRRRKNDPAKLAIAARMRKETTLSIKHIARKVCLGTSKSANARL